MKGKFKNWSEQQMPVRTFFILSGILLGLWVFYKDYMTMICIL